MSTNQTCTKCENLIESNEELFYSHFLDSFFHIECLMKKISLVIPLENHKELLLLEEYIDFLGN